MSIVGAESFNILCGDHGEWPAVHRLVCFGVDSYNLAFTVSLCCAVSFNVIGLKVAGALNAVMKALADVPDRACDALFVESRNVGNGLIQADGSMATKVLADHRRTAWNLVPFGKYGLGHSLFGLQLIQQAAEGFGLFFLPYVAHTAMLTTDGFSMA